MITKVEAAKFGQGRAIHFAYEDQLFENKIEYEAQVKTEYFEADSLEVITFFVLPKDLEKAKRIEKR